MSCELKVETGGTKGLPDSKSRLRTTYITLQIVVMDRLL